MDFTQYDTAAISNTDRAHFLHPWQIFDAIAEEGALPIAAAEGAYIYDSDGNRYLDAVGGLWCTNIGLGREEMADAIAEQVRTMAYASPFVDMTNIPAASLAAKLAELAPGDLNHVALSCGGSTAIDTAYRLIHFYQNCRGKRDKKHIISRVNSYHGSTYASMSIGGKPGDHPPEFDYIQDTIHHISCPNFYRAEECGGSKDSTEAEFLAAKQITTMIGEIDTERMEGIEASLIKGIELYFPSERFDVTLTGKTLGYLKGTKFLIKNLLISLFLAILLISLMITYLFRSYKMVIISLVPNILPLLFTAGVMGFFNIPIKPSTILVFSIAFGISVDDTIHFLVKYRQELIANNWKIRKSVFASLRETGISMFYTSIVLFFGFSVFMTSSYGGTIALGGLVSTTLLFAMLANLVLLPSLLISLEKSISNKKDLKNSVINLDSN